MLRVHEFAELAGLTVKALRHYDRLGLLAPTRSAAGYRLYQRSDLDRVDQIRALKALGIPLRRIRTLIAHEPGRLQATLREQRRVLDARRRQIEVAIEALSEAERAVAAGASPSAAIQRVISAMDRQDIARMRQYFSDEAWEQWKAHYEDWPPEEWRALYRDIAAALDSDPAGPVAQALADRWLALMQPGDSAAVRTGFITAWADRANWPRPLKQRMSDFDVERALRFIGEALWERWESEREARERAGAPGPPRASASRRALYREAAALADHDVLGPEAQRLVTRWWTLLNEETGGDEETRREVLSAFRQRHQWPSGMKRYMASLYEMDRETWERVSDFIERAATASGTLSVEH